MASFPDMKVVKAGSRSDKKRNLSILYVDDEKDLLILGKIFLERLGGFTVDIMTSALDALKSSDIQSYDAIISDYQMPVMDGVQFLQEVRRRYGDIPFILFTGRGREEIVIQAIKYGADFYQQKGGDPDAQFAELAHKIRQTVEKKHTECLLAESNKLLSDMIEFFPDPIFAIDQSGMVIVWNRALYELTGFSSDEMVGKGRAEYSAVFYAVDRPLLINLIDEPDEVIGQYYSIIQRDKHSVTAESQSFQLNGKPIYTLNKVSRLYSQSGEVSATIESIRDITSTKKTETALRRSEKRFLAVTQHTDSWIWEVDLDGIYTYASPAVYYILGYWPEELVGILHFAELYDSSIRETENARLQNIFKSYGVFNDIEHMCRHREGRPVYIKTSGVPVYDDDGRIFGYCGVDENVTKEKEITERLAESEEKFRSIVENANEIIFSLTRDGIFTYVSPKWRELLGYEISDAIGKPVSMFIHPDDYLQCHELFTRVATTGTKTGGNEIRIRKKDGTWLWHCQSLSPVHAADGTIVGLQGISYDISERKKSEDALRNANRQLNLLTSITRHDILNKLTVIIGVISVIGQEFSDSILLEYQRRMLSAAHEIRSQIEFTRVYEDIGRKEPQWIGLDAVISDMEFPTGLTLIRDLQGVTILADPMVEKVFFNLLDNSVRHGNHVTEICVSALEEGSSLVIVWKDNGSGIDPVEKEKIFERGFGKNTGLGMFLAREILSLTGISIQERGIQGTGARFEICVPKGMYRFPGMDDISYLHES